MDLPAHVKFASMPRLRREVIVTEKLDGTNGLVYISDDLTTVAAGSRNQWLTPDKPDNYDFRAWVERNSEQLRQLGPGYHYGEWWGIGVARRYNISERRFSLFNVGRWGITGKDKDKLPNCCHVVPELARFAEFDTTAIMQVAYNLKSNGSYAAPGFMDPEGIVVFHQAAQSYFKFTLDGDGHKRNKST